MRHHAASETLLLERETELAAIDALVARLVDGRGGRALIEAPAGCGKTALLNAAGDHVARSGALLLRARGSALETAFGFGIVRQLLDRPLSDARIRSTVLVGAAASAGPLFSSADEAEPAPAGSPFQMVHALHWVVLNLAERRPVVVIVDDAHDADLASLRFLAYLGRRVEHAAVTVLLATRPVEQAGANEVLDELRADADQLHIRLRPLSADAVAQLTGDRLGAEPDRAFSDACRRATGGNPFYVGELLRHVVAEHRSPTADNADWAATVGPPTIVRSMLFRMAELPPAAVPIARACAVLGDGARLAECARLAGIAAAEAARAADALVRVGLLDDPPGLSFRHPILQAAVLADLGAHERAQWHRCAADQLLADDSDPERVALHLLHTEPGGDDETVRALRAAAAIAIRSRAPSASVVFLQRALAEPVPAADEADVLFELGAVEARLGEEDGRTHLAASVRATTDPLVRARRAAHFADVSARAGALTSALAVLTDVIESLGDGDDELRLTLLATRFFTARLDRSTSDRALAWVPELRRHVDGPDTAARRQLAVYLATDAAAHVSAAQARGLLDVALAPPGLLEFVPPESMAVGMALYALTAVEDHSRLTALADAALEQSRERGALMGFVSVSMFRALQQWSCGDLAAAEASVRGALDSPGRQGWHRSAAGLVATLGLTLLDQGRTAEAADLVAQYRNRLEPRDYSTMLLLLLRGRLRLATGETAAGLADLERCGVAADAFAMRNPTLLPWRASAALALVRQGESGRAIALAGEQLAAARELAGPLAVGASQRVLGVATIAHGSLADGLALLRASLGTLTAPTARLERARTLYELGAAERRATRLVDARPHLAEALDLATGAGAHGLATAARDELVTAGARPRRVQIFGPEALTAGELRVARLAADGLSNSAIAEALFLSRKTVEKHLGNAYRKLGITSRSGLDGAALAAAGGGVADMSAG